MKCQNPVANTPKFDQVDEIVELILALTSESPATIVLDALDECQPQTRWQLLRALDRIVFNSDNLVKVFVSSRDDVDIVQSFEHAPSIRIAAADNYDDIERFVRSEVAQAASQKRLLHGQVSTALEEHIVSQLLKGAQGMFRWVEMQVRNLCDPERIKLVSRFSSAFLRFWIVLRHLTSSLS